MNLSPLPNIHRQYKKNLAYVVGLAIGDGNLSNPNGRAVRLRITCDTKYPNLIKSIQDSLQLLMPNNKVSIVNNMIKRGRCLDISCYSNKWEGLLGWKAKNGPKYIQKVSVPEWIKKDEKFIKPCLLGLMQTDGSIYMDRKYKTVMFTTVINRLANDVQGMINGLGFKPQLYKIKVNGRQARYNIRVYKNVDAFIEEIGFIKN